MDRHGKTHRQTWKDKQTDMERHIDRHRDVYMHRNAHAYSHALTSIYHASRTVSTSSATTAGPCMGASSVPRFWEGRWVIECVCVCVFRCEQGLAWVPVPCCDSGKIART